MGYLLCSGASHDVEVASVHGALEESSVGAPAQAILNGGLGLTETCQHSKLNYQYVCFPKSAHKQMQMYSKYNYLLRTYLTLV